MNEQKFEDILAQLQAIINKLENENTDIDEAISFFEQGIKLTKLAKQQLSQIKTKVTRIVNDNKISDFKLQD